MKKTLLICFLSFCFQNYTHAQSVITKAEYNKTMQSAVTNEFPFEKATTEDAIVAKLKALGYSPKSSKGYSVYKMVKLPELGTETYDLYFSADKKSKKEKEKSIVTLLISKGYDNFVNDTTGAEVLANGQKFLNNLLASIAAYDLEKQISAQEDIVKKTEKKYNNAVDDGASLEKKKKSIEEDIEKNKKDQVNKKAEADAQLQILETLRSKRIKT
jgi:hypothetical protein